MNTILPEDVSRDIGYGIEEARQFCVDLLEDVNDHTMAAKVKALFEGDDTCGCDECQIYGEHDTPMNDPKDI